VNEIITNSLTLYGIDTSTKADKATKNAVAELYRLVDTRVQAQATLTGKKPTNDDVQVIVDGILSTSRTTPGSWWGLVPLNGVSFRSTTKRLIDLTPADIPATERAQIEDSLRRHGLPVSDQTVLDVYITHQQTQPSGGKQQTQPSGGKVAATTGMPDFSTTAAIRDLVHEAGGSRTRALKASAADAFHAAEDDTVLSAQAIVGSVAAAASLAAGAVRGVVQKDHKKK
jgi:hypothetical protein